MSVVKWEINDVTMEQKSLDRLDDGESLKHI